ncbi:MAG: hypothetical protein WDZ35_05960 [Crocinitomicaceae bacterium]
MGRRIGILGLVNYKTHPTNKQYKVFSFNSLPEADMFAKELEKRSVWYERDEEAIKEGTIYLFGVAGGDFKYAMDANFAVSAKYRNPMIKNKFLRISLITITATLLTLGIIGYVKKMQTLQEKTEQLESE